MAPVPDGAPPGGSLAPPRLQLVPSAATGALDHCPRCGGSGVLRTDSSGFRTCLDCAGQGALPPLEVARALEPPLRFPGRPQRPAWEVSACSSGAR